MIRTLRHPHPSTAAQLRFVAFVATAVCVVIVVSKVLAAATGRDSIADAIGWTIAALALAASTAVMARSLDPLRRR